MDSRNVEEIVVAGRTLSPAQYAWLFDDLRPLDQKQASNHWREHGRQEIDAFSRSPEYTRLAPIDFQQMSEFPESAPSQFFRFRPGSTNDILNVIFSYTFVPPGKFGMSRVIEGVNEPVLFFNTTGNDWYQEGVEGIATSLEGVARFVARVAHRLGAKKIRVMGSSMGGYAAIVIGSLVDASTVIAGDAELEIGIEGYRSWAWSQKRVYDPNYRDTEKAALRLGNRLCLFQASIDPIEGRWQQKALDAGINVVSLPTIHGASMAAVQWGQYFKQPMSDPRLFLMAEVGSPFDRKQVAKLRLLHELASSGRHRDAVKIAHELADAHSFLFGYVSVLSWLIGAKREAASALHKFANWTTVDRLDFYYDVFYDIQGRYGLSSAAAKEASMLMYRSFTSEIPQFRKAIER